MAIRYTAHARERMYERGVTEEHVEFALRYYMTSFETPGGSTQLRAMFADGSVLKVWIAGGIPLGPNVIIKSTAWMEPNYD